MPLEVVHGLPDGRCLLPVAVEHLGHLRVRELLVVYPGDGQDLRDAVHFLPGPEAGREGKIGAVRRCGHGHRDLNPQEIVEPGGTDGQMLDPEIGHQLTPFPGGAVEGLGEVDLVEELHAPDGDPHAGLSTGETRNVGGSEGRVLPAGWSGHLELRRRDLVLLRG